MPDLPARWQETVRGFRFVPVLSEPQPGDGWTGRTGLVHRAVMDDHHDLSGHQVYASGTPAMVEAARRDFFSACRLPETEFFADSFLTEAELAQPAPAERRSS
jgi:CDP-4-dehydro-6-deoxyglucose reductase